MKGSVIVEGNKVQVDDIDIVLDEYYKFYIKNGSFPSSFSKDKEERRLCSSFYYCLSNASNFCLTKEQEKRISLISDIKQKHERYNKLLENKKLVEKGEKKDLYNFLLTVSKPKNHDALLRAFEEFVIEHLSDTRRKKLYEIENLRRKVNYLALEIKLYIEENDLSPSSIYCKKCYIRSFDGKVMTMRCAYDFVRENVNYIDDDLLEKLNNCRRIKKKLVKQEINNLK